MIYINVHVFCLSSGIFLLSGENEALHEKTSGNKSTVYDETVLFMFGIPVQLRKLEGDKGLKNFKNLAAPLLCVPL